MDNINVCNLFSSNTDQYRLFFYFTTVHFAICNTILFLYKLQSLKFRN